MILYAFLPISKVRVPLKAG